MIHSFSDGYRYRWGGVRDVAGLVAPWCCANDRLWRAREWLTEASGRLGPRWQTLGGPGSTWRHPGRVLL